MHDFFLICPIGLESALLKEINLKGLKCYLEKIELTKGGIQVRSSLEVGLCLNKQLKGVSRILLRLKEQKCRDFPKLFQIISKINFGPFLTHEDVNFVVSSSKSRLINTKKIKNTCEKALEKYFKGQPLKKKYLENSSKLSEQKVFIRLFKDGLQVSIDTTGELSHKRGHKTYTGHAAFRETYASLLMTHMMPLDSNYDVLVDPFCGTGTILSEAKNYFKTNTRDFAFQGWPITTKIKDKIDHYLKDSEVAYKDLTFFSNFYAFDKDENLFNLGKRSFEGIICTKKDLFKDDFSILNRHSAEERFVFTNPPFGKRIKIKGDRVDFFNNLVNAIQVKINPAIIAFIAPSVIPLAYPKVLEFNNNGIRVTLYKLELA